MSRMTKTLKAVQKQLKLVEKNGDGDVESPQGLDISSIEKDSFLHGDQYSSHGNPLHSTALEEDLSPGAEQNRRSATGKTGRQGVGKTAAGKTAAGKTAAGKTAAGKTAAGKTAAGKTAAGVLKVPETKSKTVPTRLGKITTSKQNREQSQAKNQGAASTVRGVKGNLPTISEHKEGSDKKRASLITTSQKGQNSAKGTSMSSGVNQRQQTSSSSSEEITDEDESFHPSNKKSKSTRSSSSRRQSGQKQKRKSSSDSSDKAGPSKKARDLRSPSDLDVVLDAFQEFVSQYKQTVNSDNVNRTIDSFSRSVEEQLSEIITESREMKNLKRENSKLNGAINKKRNRLLEANNDFIKGKSKLTALQKEHDELEQRLRALREGTSFLSNMQDLNRRYMKHRIAHPDELETYGPSCMPAMLLESRCIMGTEQQLKTVNDQLQQIIDKTEG